MKVSFGGGDMRSPPWDFISQKIIQCHWAPPRGNTVLGESPWVNVREMYKFSSLIH